MKQIVFVGRISSVTPDRRLFVAEGVIHMSPTCPDTIS
jgi:hypothetical protein